MIKSLHISLFLILLSYFSFGQSLHKMGNAKRVSETLKIDGNLSEPSWQDAKAMSGFRQYDPYYDKDVTFQTEVKILYDDDAFYVGAVMFDSSPDSILKQLGDRDASLNADAFGIRIDTYNKQNDAYVFEVAASGVQVDYRENDLNFNAVWESVVKINKDYWVVEMRIPYAAIRFPRKAKQEWRIQLYRNLRRIRELSQWALEEKQATNKRAYWGELQGIENIKPPLRLSLTPYLSAQIEHYPYNIDNLSNYSKRLSGGIDMKLGLGESHTLDVTLLPDFSQVQSDNQVKNLSAFETVYDEKRPFFQESVDLFNKGGLFYSRRIGRIPIRYDNVEDSLKTNEHIISNPYQSKLINATKFSGRGKNGFAVGIFNAVTDRTYAIIGDSSVGERRLMTDPLTNYNIIVFDKAFKNSSSAYFINTNVLRQNDFNSANVTGAGVNLLNKSNTYNINLTGSHSRIYNPQKKLINSGNTYLLDISKVKGNFLFNVYRELIDDKYNKNDMGLLFNNSVVGNGINLFYNIYEPFSHFLYFKTKFTILNNYHFITHKTTSRYAELYATTTLRNYLSFWSAAYTELSPKYDYYEPRMAGRYFLAPIYSGFYFNFSSDYRKTFALDGGLDVNVNPGTSSVNQTYILAPIVRANDHLSFNMQTSLVLNKNNLGYAGKDSLNNIYFGQRDLQTLENTISGLYVIKNDLSVSLRARHYWVIGKYNAYSLLRNDGTLERTTAYNPQNDFNFNSFNIDVVFNWQFAPGSNLSVIWKNALLNEDNKLVYNYFDNFSHTLSYPQLNTLTVKFLYYIDYVSIKRKFGK